jgi:signal transduction histidine kinase
MVNNKYITALAFFVLYIITAKLGMQYLSLRPGNLTVLWFPSGIALIAVIVFGFRALPFIWLASFYSNYDGLFSSVNGLELWQIYLADAFSASCDTLQPAIAGFFWKRSIHSQLNTTSDFYKFILFVAFIPCLVAASLLGINLYSFHYFDKLTNEEIFRTIGVLAFGDTIGIYVTVPLYLFWRKPEFEGKFYIFVSLLLIQSTILFVVIRYFPFLYFLSFFVLILLGYFNRLKGITVGIFQLYLFSVVMTKMGIGPFIYPEIFLSYIYLISFLVPFSLLAEFMTILYTRVENHQLELEKKVLERTKLLRLQIIEKNKAIDALNLSESRLSESNKTKDKFFSIIAHDLKNPLSSYQQVTKMLIDEYSGYTEKQVLEVLGQISDSSEKVYQLLEHLLDWARTQTHTIPFMPKEINLFNLAVECLTEADHKIKAKKIQACVIGTHSAYCHIDESMIRLVIRNLISNALKFTKANGTIEISISEKDHEVQLECRDTGVGMDSEGVEKLFRIDAQYKSLGLDGETGTGLGLILCKEFIAKHNGQIWAESNLGQGTKVSFRIAKKR